MKPLYPYCFFLTFCLFFAAFSLSILHATEHHNFIEDINIKKNALIKKIRIEKMQKYTEYQHFNTYLEQYSTSEENKKNIRAIWIHYALKLVQIELDPFTAVFKDLEEKHSKSIQLPEDGRLFGVWNKTHPFEKGLLDRICSAFETSTVNYEFVKNNLETIYLQYLIYDFLFGKDAPLPELYKVSHKTLERQSRHAQEYFKYSTFRFQNALRKLECCKWDVILSFDSPVNSLEAFFKEHQIKKNWRAKISNDLFNRTLDCLVNAYQEHKGGLTKGKIVIKTNFNIFPALKKLQEEGGFPKIKQEEDHPTSQEVTTVTQWDSERIYNLKHLYPRYKKEKNQATKMKKRDARALDSNEKEKGKEKEKDPAVDKPLTSSNRMDPGFTRSAYEKLIALKADERWESLDSNLKFNVEEYIEMYQNIENAKAKRSLKALYKQLLKLMDLQRNGKGSHKVLYFLFAKDKPREDTPGSEKIKEN